MTDTNKLFELAQLAEASYADFQKFSNDSFEALKASDFSVTQATEFTQRWQVISHQPDTASGFSATFSTDMDGAA